MYTYQNTWLDYGINGNPLVLGENITSSCYPSTPALASVNFTMPSGRFVNGPVNAYNYGVADALIGAPLDWPDGTVESGEAVYSGSNLLSFPTACFVSQPLFRIAHTSFGPPPIETENFCIYTTITCSTGRPTCPAALPNILFAFGCPNYVQAAYLVVNGACIAPGLERAKSGPAPCD
jgi:hypothetical protein